AKYTDTSKVSNSLIANGCIIEGEVSNSIIFRRVKVQKGAVINNSIIMQNGTVKENAVLNHVIIDKNVIIEKEKELKGDKDFPLVIEKRLLYLEK
ncbi:MAG: glucose-1-phosphate adenylyltransferase subunit GlgD, partial [Clostridiaceae bacterium]